MWDDNNDKYSSWASLWNQLSLIPPTMEDKNPWNGYEKPSFHILNLSNVQM